MDQPTPARNLPHLIRERLPAILGGGCLLVAAAYAHFTIRDGVIPDMTFRVGFAALAAHVILMNHFQNPKSPWGSRSRRIARPFLAITFGTWAGLFIGIVLHGMMVEGREAAEPFHLKIWEEFGIVFLVLFLLLAIYIALGRARFRKILRTLGLGHRKQAQDPRYLRIDRIRLIVSMVLLTPALLLPPVGALLLCLVAVAVGGMWRRVLGNAKPEV